MSDSEPTAAMLRIAEEYDLLAQRALSGWDDPRDFIPG
jgi:hypothetical protein